MQSDKFKACGFVELRPRDKYYGAEIIDKHGNTHKVIGKRGDWLYITNQDRIFTASQLNDLICRHPQYIPTVRVMRGD